MFPVSFLDDISNNFPNLKRTRIKRYIYTCPVINLECQMVKRKLILKKRLAFIQG